MGSGVFVLWKNSLNGPNNATTITTGISVAAIRKGWAGAAGIVMQMPLPSERTSLRMFGQDSAEDEHTAYARESHRHQRQHDARGRGVGVAHRHDAHERQEHEDASGEERQSKDGQASAALADFNANRG